MINNYYRTLLLEGKNKFVSSSDKNVLRNHKPRQHQCSLLDEPMNFIGVDYRNMDIGLFTEVKNFAQKAHVSLGVSPLQYRKTGKNENRCYPDHIIRVLLRLNFIN